MKTFLVLSFASILFLGALASAAGTSSSSDRAAQMYGTSSSLQKDSDLIRRLRSQIAQDSSLSDEAKAVSVTTRNGRVVLKGSVENATEKEKLDSMARAASGSSRVDNQIVISE